jgi:hypothetical protein
VAKKPEPAAPANIVALYERLVATNPKVERKGAAFPYTSRNGHMFSQLTKDGRMILKLPPDDLTKFLAKYKTKLSVQYGVIQKEFAVVPDALLKKTAELKKYFDLGFEYVGSLKPKPTTKPKKA